MYLFVFVFVIMSIMGLFTELYMLKLSNLASKQTIVAETMMFWHDAAAKFAKDHPGIVIPATTGCFIGPFGGGPACGIVAGVAPTFTRGPIALPPPSVSSRIYLPADYNIGDAELVFRTKLFMIDTTRYAITYLLTDDGFRLGYTVDQVYTQMNKSGMSKISYGRVNAACGAVTAPPTRYLVTLENINGVPYCYTLASSLAITEGAIGIITNLGD